MRKRRCSLCGGKLVDNRCTECGLDNSRNDDMYKDILNKSNCDEKAMTHVHEHKKQHKKKKSTSIGLRIVYILFAIAVIGFMAWSQMNESSFDSTFEGWNQDSSYEERDPYEYVERELAEEGENWEMVLDPGIYEVGVHIPEGLYSASIEDGASGYIYINDEQNSIYYTISFGDYEGAVHENEDVRLYDGAFLEVSQKLNVKIKSENAQTANMHGIVNPLAKEVIVHENVKSGEDFEPGFYDVVFVSTDTENIESGWVTIKPSIEDMENDIRDYVLYFDANWGNETYRNVFLPKETTVVMEGVKEIKLVPSTTTGKYD